MINNKTKPPFSAVYVGSISGICIEDSNGTLIAQALDREVSLSEARSNVDLFVRAANNHDALVALLSNLHSHLDGYDMGGALTMRHRINDAIKSATGMNAYEYKAKKREA